MSSVLVSVMKFGPDCVRVSCLYSGRPICALGVTQSSPLFGCWGLASVMLLWVLVMMASQRSESIILVRAGCGVGGSIRQRSCVFSEGLSAVWTSHEERGLKCTKNSSVLTVGVSSAMGIAVVLYARTIPTWLVTRSE